MGNRQARRVDSWLTLVETVAVLGACLWPVALTMGFATGREVRWGASYYLVIGLVLLAVSTAIRRDLRRFVYMAGPFALLMYAALLASACIGFTAKGYSGNGVIGTGLGATILFFAALWWTQRLRKKLSLS